MGVIRALREKAKQAPKRIVFPEIRDERVKVAIEIVRKEDIAIPVVLSHDNMEKEKQEEFATFYYELRKNKYNNYEEVRELMEDKLYYAAMMVRFGYADGFVAGASYTTSSVARAAIQCLEIEEEFGLVSSCFLMQIPECTYGEGGVFIYADCGIIPYPTSEQLALIAGSAAKFARDVLEIEPRVALLSFSTKGSAQGRWIDKVREATEIAREKFPHILIDGELQADAALDIEVAKRKLPASGVAGRANVLIFPNLDAGNICYKLTQRLAKARAVGPVILGLKQPCSDLSRGCNVEDVVDCTATTVVRAQKLKTSKNENISS